jgi:hypothetical protein
MKSAARIAKGKSTKGPPGPNTVNGTVPPNAAPTRRAHRIHVLVLVEPFELDIKKPHSRQAAERQRVQRELGSVLN